MKVKTESELIKMKKEIDHLENKKELLKTKLSEINSLIDRKSFKYSLEKAAYTVSTWPKWKQNACKFL